MFIITAAIVFGPASHSQKDLRRYNNNNNNNNNDDDDDDDDSNF